MEQQLRSQIEKNKTLLNANMTLMQQNELYMNALSQLKKYMIDLTHMDHDDDNGSSICADEAESFVVQVMQKIREIKEHGQADNTCIIDKTELKGKGGDVSNRECECEKWKNMYMNESEESLRLSKKLVEAEQNISRIEEKHQIQYKQMDNILKQYLTLFQRVNSIQFLQSEASSQKKIKQPTKQNLRSNTSKQKRSNSKPKNLLKSNSNSKKASKMNTENDKTISNTDIIPPTVTNEVIDFPNFIAYLQNLRTDYNNVAMEIKMVREELSDAQILIRAYREKERERVAYGRFVLQ